jgi:hypothetical protein
MDHLMNNLPVLGTLGVAAVLVGPLARLPIDLGAWFLDVLVRWICATAARHRHRGRVQVNGRQAGTRARWGPL